MALVDPKQIRILADEVQDLVIAVRNSCDELVAVNIQKLRDENKGETRSAVQLQDFVTIYQR